MTLNKEALEEVMRKAKKLMAFTPETATEAEVANATAILHKMLAKYQLSIADINAGTLGEDLEKNTIKFSNDSIAKKTLLFNLARGFSCNGWLQKVHEPGIFGGIDTYEAFNIIGTTSDIEMVKHLYLSILPQLEKMAETAWEYPHKRGFKTFRDSFIYGAALTIKDRLKATAPTSDEKGLVVVKDGLVKQWMKKNAPPLNRTSFSVDHGGLNAGKNAGHKVGLHAGVNGTASKNRMLT